MEADQEKRKQLVWEIERQLAEDVARPVLYHNRVGHLLAPLRQGLHADGQQHLQRQAHGGRVARPVIRRAAPKTRRSRCGGIARRRGGCAGMLAHRRRPGSGAKTGRHPADVHPDSPASMSIHEEATVFAAGPDDGRLQQSRHVRPARAAEQPASRSCPIWRPSWSWNEDGTELTFQLRQGVKWHDGKPFTAKDVKCTWDLLLGKSSREVARQSAQVLVPATSTRSPPTAITRSPFI